MSRGGRGGGRGGKGAPDMSWDDEEPAEAIPNSRKPGPLFPEHKFPVPKPLTTSEKASVKSLISIRDRLRRGPLYATLDPTIVHHSSTTTKNTYQSTIFTTQREHPLSSFTSNSRIGFDPFNDQEKYTMKYHRKKRTVPDLSEREGYTLKFFPLELWSTLDPRRKMSDWKDLTDEQKARISGPVAAATRTRKRKREQALKFADEDDDEQPSATRVRRNSDSEASSSSEVVSPSTRRRRRDALQSSRKDEKDGKTRQKKGLDAEDDYPDVDQDHVNNEDADAANNAEDEPHDSEFETDEDGEDGMDDYNAEQYFDDGADDGDGGYGGGDGEDDDGGGGGYY